MRTESFKEKIWLSSPTMHGDELRYVTEAIKTNWVSTVGENLTELEKLACAYIGCGNAVALSSGTAALHLAVKLAGERLYGQPRAGHGALEGRKVFCSDMTFSATVNPVAYEGGKAVFIDSEYETWNMDPAALEKAFAIYPDVKLVVLANLYGTPAKMDEILAVCKAHGALLIEDAAESLGATYGGPRNGGHGAARHVFSSVYRGVGHAGGDNESGENAQTGTFGDYSVISFNGNKIITGSSGGMLLTDDEEAADKARKWSTQSREAALWYQHEELGYNYRMSNIIAGIARGQFPYLEEHIRRKKEIYMRYKECFKDLPVRMNPYIEGEMEPNFWLSCLLIDREAMCRQVRGERDALYLAEKGKSCPTQILEKLAAYNAEGRPIWKPMHLQPLYRMNPFITRNGSGRAGTDAYSVSRRTPGAGTQSCAVGLDIGTQEYAVGPDARTQSCIVAPDVGAQRYTSDPDTGLQRCTADLGARTQRCATDTCVGPQRYAFDSDAGIRRCAANSGAGTQKYVSGPDMRTQDGTGRSDTDMPGTGVYGWATADASTDIFARGLCLPSDIKMTREEQDRVIAIVQKCFDDTDQGEYLDV